MYSISLIVLCLFILYLNIGTTLISRRDITYLIFSRGLQIFGIISIVCYLIHKVMNDRKIRIYDILVIFLSLFLFLSYLFAFNKEVALIGELNRNEGLLTLLSYYAFFLLSTTLKEKDSKKIIVIFLLSCFYQITLGIFQTLKMKHILGYDRSGNWSARWSMASGTHGNPNFYSTYILLGLLCVYSKFLKLENLKSKIAYLCLLVFFFLGLLMGNTLSCILSFLFIVVITLLIKIVKKKDKKLLVYLAIGILLLSIVVTIINTYSKDRIFKMMHQNCEEIQLILTGNIDENTGNGRLYVWKEALSKTNQYYLLGIGIDNFSYLDDGEYIGVETKYGLQYFDKAHNEYIQIFITEGIFVFLMYLFLVGYILKNANKRNIVFIPVLGYLMQAFLNISVINVAPIFYIFLGFLVPRRDNKNTNENIIFNVASIFYIFLGFLIPRRDNKNTNKNIMFIIEKLSNGGAEKVIANLSNYYHEQMKDSNIIVVTGDLKKNDYVSHAKVIVVKNVFHRNQFLKSVLKIRKLKKQYNIATSISFLVMPDILNYCSRRGEKIIMSNRNYMSVAIHYRTLKFPKYRRYAKLNTMAMKRADVVVNCSKSVEYDQIHSFHMKPKKMVTIPNFIDIEAVQTLAQEPINQEYIHLFDENTILVVARYHPQKGIPYIIKILPEILREKKNVRLVLMGRGEEEELYKKMITDNHLENNIFMIPFDSNPYKYMKRAGMLVLNSIHEGFPNVILEAMACGLPVIATDCYGGTSEILDETFELSRIKKRKEAKYGILIPPPKYKEYNQKKITRNEEELKKAILLLLSNQKLKEHYQNMSKKRVQDYKKNEIIKMWNEII